jgi:acylphosphatase
MKCVHLIFIGKVQGVFFRSNAMKKAVELGIKGYARNLDDGTVEVVAQGSPERIQILVDFLKEGQGSARVDEIKSRDIALGKFDKFEINY